MKNLIKNILNEHIPGWESDGSEYHGESEPDTKNIEIHKSMPPSHGYLIKIIDKLLMRLPARFGEFKVNYEDDYINDDNNFIYKPSVESDDWAFHLSYSFSHDDNRIVISISYSDHAWDSDVEVFDADGNGQKASINYLRDNIENLSE